MRVEAHDTYRATFYFQGGAAGSCGQVNPDSALIVAVRTYLPLTPLPALSPYPAHSLLYRGAKLQRSELRPPSPRHEHAERTERRSDDRRPMPDVPEQPELARSLAGRVRCYRR